MKTPPPHLDMPHCLLCGWDYTEIQNGARVRMLRDCVVNTLARHGYPQTSVACARCAFVQVDPMPSDAEVAAYYESGAYRREFPPLPRCGVDPSHPDYVAVLDEAAGEEAAFVCQQLQFMAPRRIHEVGCGEGRLAHALSLRGHNVSAWDDDPSMRKAAQSRGVRTVGRIAGDERDAVVACQVLEHVTDPIATLTEWRAMLKPGGLLHVQVPTLEAMYGGASHFFQRPHLVNFTRRTLLLTLMRAGFRPGSIGISGCVLYCTAFAADACLSYEQAVEHLGELVKVYERVGMTKGGLPVDDVPALIAAHEANRPKPSLLDRWIAGEGDTEIAEDDGFVYQEGYEACEAAAARSAEMRAEARALRDEVVKLRAERERQRDAWITLSRQMQAEIERLAEAWSPDPWQHGFQCGVVRTLKSTQTVVDAQANNLIRRMGT